MSTESKEKVYLDKSPHPYCKKKDCECSFASHPLSKNWHNTLNGKLTPGDVSRCSKTMVYFLCDVCNHTSQLSLLRATTAKEWCIYCSKREWIHCENEVCEFCYERSFASHPRSSNWLDFKNNKPALHVVKTSEKLYWFKCEDCLHEIQQAPSRIVSQNRWCIYCSAAWKHCPNNDCDFCFKRSFASHSKSKFWDLEKNKDISAKQFSISSQKKCWFVCDACKHSFSKTLATITAGEWCPYCSSGWKHCGATECEWCFNRSFASTEKYKDWHPTKNNELNAMYIPKASGAHECWFVCNICNHDYKTTLREIYNKQEKTGCPYCNGPSWKHCGNENCEFCFKRSFASHFRSKMLHPTKNINFNPLHVAKMSQKHEAWFLCKDCKTEFKKKIFDVTQSSWCGVCSFDTEKKMIMWLSKIYTVKHQKKFDWCRNVTFQKLRYDCYIEELKLIIEIDGLQHFQQVLEWRSPKINQEFDIFKMKCLLKNKLSIIRIFQEDVLYDKNDWENALLEAIKNVENGVKVQCIKTNKDVVNIVYEEYGKKMKEFLEILKTNPDIEIKIEENVLKEITQSDEDSEISEPENKKVKII